MFFSLRAGANELDLVRLMRYFTVTQNFDEKTVILDFWYFLLAKNRILSLLTIHFEILFDFSGIS